MAERQALQSKCKSLKRYLPPGAKCTTSTELLRTHIAYAEAQMAQQPVPVAPSIEQTAGNVALPLPNDLLEVVSTYTVHSITEYVITLDSDTARRFAYDASYGLWRKKVIVERKGVVFDDVVIRANGGLRTWYTYYRIANRREYGTAALLTNKEELVRLPHSDSTGVSVASDHVIHVFTADKWYIYRIKVRGPERYELLDTIALRGVVWAGGESAHQSVAKRGELVYFAVTERGELYRYSQGEYSVIAENIVSGKFWYSGLSILDRSGGWRSIGVPSSPISVPVVWINPTATYEKYTAEGNTWERVDDDRSFEWRAGAPVVLSKIPSAGRTYYISIQGTGLLAAPVKSGRRTFYESVIPAIGGFLYSQDPYDIPSLFLVNGDITRIPGLPPVKLQDTYFLLERYPVEVVMV